jgi:hypothetical protein
LLTVSWASTGFKGLLAYPHLLARARRACLRQRSRRPSQLSVLWQHYLVLVFVCLAALPRLRDPVSWLLLAAPWPWPAETPATESQAWLAPLKAAAVVIRAVSADRREGARTATSHAVPAAGTS